MATRRECHGPQAGAPVAVLGQEALDPRGPHPDQGRVGPLLPGPCPPCAAPHPGRRARGQPSVTGALLRAPDGGSGPNRRASIHIPRTPCLWCTILVATVLRSCFQRIIVCCSRTWTSGGGEVAVTCLNCCLAALVCGTRMCIHPPAAWS